MALYMHNNRLGVDAYLTCLLAIAVSNFLFFLSLKFVRMWFKILQNFLDVDMLILFYNKVTRGCLLPANRFFGIVLF